jgi:hypothetical protein
MAVILQFTPVPSSASAGQKRLPAPRSYSVDVSAHSDGYLEFTASGVRADGASLSEIADELEKIASIIRSDVISKAN